MINFEGEELMQRDEGSYIASTANSSDGHFLYDVLVTKCKCDDQPGAACTQAVTVHYLAHAINMQWEEERVRKLILITANRFYLKFYMLNC
jgi:hypothetical protein